MSVLALLRRSKQEIENSKPNHGNDLVKLKKGNNYLRVFPNKADPENGTFFHKYGLHFTSRVTPEGKKEMSAIMCHQHTKGDVCPLCNMVEEARMKYRGDEKMKEVIREVAASPRYVVSGMLSQNEQFTDCEKPMLIDLPSAVLEDVISLMTQDMEDGVSEPLSRELGFPYLIKRSGEGLNTKYEVLPQRRLKSELTSQMLEEQPDPLAFINQDDRKKVPLVASMASATLGIAAPSGAIESKGGLPGMTSAGSTGTSAGGLPSGKADDKPFTEEKSAGNEILNEELNRAEEAVFEPVKEEKKAEPSSDEGIDDALAQLEALGGL